MIGRFSPRDHRRADLAELSEGVLHVPEREDAAAAFDREVEAIVAPYLPDGKVTLRTVGEIVLGHPAPIRKARWLGSGVCGGALQGLILSRRGKPELVPTGREIRSHESITS
jgi:hypothetical protein